ncbi:MAG: LysM peptidoglycan-binding domain-containing protein [Anaerolineae bacterium]
MKRLIFLLLLMLLLVSALPGAASATPLPQTSAYVVKPDDTLASIARQFCTTWQQLYALNRNVIGPNPNVLRWGTVLQVPSSCGQQPPPSGTPQPGGCSLSPIDHARGTVSGNVYIVTTGDTLYSIARRFCTTVEQLGASNSIGAPWRIQVGQRLTVPAGSAPGGTVTPTPTRPSSEQRYLRMDAPRANETVPMTFTARGTGAGLFEGNVVVTAYNEANQQLARQIVILQGTNVGTGAPGTWTATLTVNVPNGTRGYVEVTSPQSNVAPVRVNVVYGQTPTSAAIAITSPTANATVGSSINVTGTATGLAAGSRIIVHALNSGGTVSLTQGYAIVGSDGRWGVPLIVANVGGQNGIIFAYAEQNPGVSTRVAVRY